MIACLRLFTALCLAALLAACASSPSSSRTSMRSAAKRPVSRAGKNPARTRRHHSELAVVTLFQRVEKVGGGVHFAVVFDSPDHLRTSLTPMMRHVHPEDFPKRDDPNWMKHTVAWSDGWGGAQGSNGGSVRIDYRPVHDFTLTDEIAYIKPKARVY